MCIYVFIYVCIHVCMYDYMHTYVLYMYICIYFCKHVCVHAYIYVYILWHAYSVCLCIYVFINECTNECMYVNVHACVPSLYTHVTVHIFVMSRNKYDYHIANMSHTAIMLNGHRFNIFTYMYQNSFSQLQYLPNMLLPLMNQQQIWPSHAKHTNYFMYRYKTTM